MKKIAVLMSAYNGTAYIQEQIESIYAQSYRNFELYVRDDGSSEVFVETLQRLQKKYSFHLIEGKNLGFIGSFMTMLKQVDDADLYAFADQDDIWLPNKLQMAVNWFEQQKYDKKPLLYHSAYDIIGGRKTDVIGHFYYSEDGYDFRRSITENHYSGFSMVINDVLRAYMLKGDWQRIDYHDWWAAMIAHAFGKSYSDDTVTALHRAHGDNVTTFTMRTRLQWLKKSLTEESAIHKRSVEFERCFGERLTSADRCVLTKFTDHRYHLGHAFWKACYPHRWRPVWSSELVLRGLMLVGKV